jgi:uncharacterized membrane protein
MDLLIEFLATLLIALGTGIAVGTIIPRIRRGEFCTSGHMVDRLFYVSVAVFALVFAAFAVLRYVSLATQTTDLAQYDQLVWNSLHGRLFENSLIPDAPLFIGKSFIPIMLAFVPMYAVWSNPIILLLVQAIALVSGVLPIYWFARQQLGHALALGVGCAYLLSPVIGHMNAIDFHEIALATPLLAYASFFLLRRNHKAFLITLAVALLVKEEIAFVAAGFGVFIFLFHKNRVLGLALALGGVAWGALLLQFVIPFFHGSQPGRFYYFSSGWIAGGATRYGYLGNSLSEIALTVITRPDIVLLHLWKLEKIQFVLHLLVPLAFLPLLGADVALLALPTLGYSLLSDYKWQVSIQTAYPAPLLPFLFFAATVGLRRLLAWRISNASSSRVAFQGALLATLFTASAISYVLYSPGPFARGFRLADYVVTEHSVSGLMLIRTIPGDAVVVAQNEFLGHLSNRRAIYEIPLIPDYRQADYLFADQTRPWYAIHQDAWEHFLNSGFFDIVTQRDGYVIARRRLPTHLSSIRFDDQVRLLGYAMVPPGTLRGGVTLRPVLEWRAENPLTHRYKIAVRVVDARGHVWAADDREPHDAKSPTTRWELGKTISDQYTLPLPPTMPTGDYQITVAVYASTENGHHYLRAYDAQDHLLETEVTLTTVRVEKNKTSFTASELQIEQLQFADMREMRLLGFVPPRETIAPGELLQVGLYWRVRGKPQGDYIVAVQLRDMAGRVAFEHSDRPAEGTYPTTLWDAGEVLLDWHDFVLPQNLAGGGYTIHVVLRDTANSQVLGETGIASLEVVNH